MPDPVRSAPTAPTRAAGRVMFERLCGDKRFLVIADFREDGSCCFTQGKIEEGTWHRFLPSAEEIEQARRRLTEEQHGHTAATVVAAHVLARAALDALTAVTAAEGTGHAYQLLDVEAHDLPSNDAHRLGLLRETLERLLAGPLPPAPRQDVQRVIQERLQAAQGALPIVIAPSSLPGQREA